MSAVADDPWVMYLVVPHRPDPAELLSSAGLATLRCASAYERSEAWSDAFLAWRGSSFRKVCLRADAEELERADRLEHTAAGVVRCFPPRRRSAAEEALSSLRAHTGGALHGGEPGAVEVPAGGMLLLIEEDLGLTAGKACAQIGHGVLIGRAEHHPARVAVWEAAGWPLAVGLVPGDGFARAAAELPAAAVRDAGFTQVRPGTETVLSLEPGLIAPAWLAETVRPAR